MACGCRWPRWAARLTPASLLPKLNLPSVSLAHRKSPSHTVLSTTSRLPMVLGICNKAGETKNTNCKKCFNFFKTFDKPGSQRQSYCKHMLLSEYNSVTKYPLTFHFFHFFQRDYTILALLKLWEIPSYLKRNQYITPTPFKPPKNNQAEGTLTCNSRSHQNIFWL